MYKLEKFYPQGFNFQRYRDDKYSDKYSREHIAGKSSEEFRKQGFWPLLERHLEKGKRYLDAGCGVGGWILFLKETGYDVEGIDTAAKVARALTEYDRDLKVKVAGMTAIPYPDDSLDGLLAIGALEYVEDKVPQALKEAYRVLKNDGIFFLEVPMINALRRLAYIPLKRIEKMVRVGGGEKSTFSNYLFDKNELEELLKAAGFEVLAVQPHELPEADGHYGLYVDWPFFRGSEPYRLNLLGKAVKALLGAVSPWVASTGLVIVARKRKHE